MWLNGRILDYHTKGHIDMQSVPHSLWVVDLALGSVHLLPGGGLGNIGLHPETAMHKKIQPPFFDGKKA